MTNLKLMAHHDFDESETSAGCSITRIEKAKTCIEKFKNAKEKKDF